jgi:ketosteroid isomerase-like protein
MSRLTERVRHAYQAFAEDPERLWDRFDDDVVFHISGEHPLSGDYVGVAEFRRYLAAVNEATAGRGGFSVTSAFSDDSGSEVLVEGTAFHGEGPFVRTVVHRLRLSEGRLVEFRDHPFDQESEDRFWSARVPAQRDGERADATAETSPEAAAGGPTAAPVIPPQPTSSHITKH